MSSCGVCGEHKTSSLGMRGENIICHACGAHEYFGEWIDKKSWDAWVNSVYERPPSTDKGRAEIQERN